MKITYFGTFSKGEGYPRNAMILEGLRSAGAQVEECHFPLWRGTSEKERSVTSFLGGMKVVFRFFLAWFVLTFKYLFYTKPHDLILVGYPGHLDVFLAKLLGFIKRKPVVFDAFISLYEAVVEDRALVHPYSLRARLLKKLDVWSAKVADLVLLDTETHMEYYQKELGISNTDLLRVFVGGEENYFHPTGRKRETHERIKVLFFGGFLPLHGADVIVKAIALLSHKDDLAFTFVGDGPEWKRCHDEAEGIKGKVKVEWIKRWVSYSELRDIIEDADICLGIFGDNGKALRVIPCKVFNILAMRKPLITADTPAVREAIADRREAILVERNNPKALAQAIEELASDSELRRSLAERGYQTYMEKFTAQAIGKKLLDELEQRFSGR